LIVIRGGREVAGTFAVARRHAATIQQRVSDEFQLAKAYGGALKANSRDYDIWKILNGFDIRRGHKTGQLQEAMEEVQCWRVVPMNAKDVEIRFSDAFLRRLAPYAEFYIAAKTRRGIVMAATTKDARSLQAELNALERAKGRKDRTRPARVVQPPPRPPVQPSGRVRILPPFTVNRRGPVRVLIAPLRSEVRV
jgi:hypothetical protein